MSTSHLHPCVYEHWRNTSYGRVLAEAEKITASRIADNAKYEQEADLDGYLMVYAQDDYSHLRPTEAGAFYEIKAFTRARFVAKRQLAFSDLYPTTANYERHKMTLKQIHALRNEVLQWLDMGQDFVGKKTIVKVLVSLSDEDLAG